MKIANLIKRNTCLVLASMIISVFIFYSIPVYANRNISDAKSIEADTSFQYMSIDDLTQLADSLYHADSLDHSVLPLALRQIVGNIKLFGVYRDTSINQPLDQFVINNLISIYQKQNVTRFHPLNELEKVYAFTELSGLKLYQYSCPPTPMPEDRHIAILFNEYDSTLYQFDGYGPNFSKLMRPYLPMVIKENRLIDLIKLYINTLAPANCRIIISGIDTYKELWRQALDDKYLPEEYEALKVVYQKDIAEIEDYPDEFSVITHFNTNAQYYDIYLATWDLKYGLIEKWHFCVSENVFEVKERYAVLIHKGPWLGLLRGIMEK